MPPIIGRDAGDDEAACGGAMLVRLERPWGGSDTEVLSTEGKGRVVGGRGGRAMSCDAGVEGGAAPGTGRGTAGSGCCCAGVAGGPEGCLV